MAPSLVEMSIDCADLINNGRAEENCCDYYILECLFWDNVNEIAKDINENKVTKDIALRCRSHNLATTYIFIVYSNRVSHTIIQKLNGILLNECTKYGFHLVDIQKEFVEGWCSSSRKR